MDDPYITRYTKKETTREHTHQPSQLNETEVLQKPHATSHDDAILIAPNLLSSATIPNAHNAMQQKIYPPRLLSPTIQKPPKPTPQGSSTAATDAPARTAARQPGARALPPTSTPATIHPGIPARGRRRPRNARPLGRGRGGPRTAPRRGSFKPGGRRRRRRRRRRRQL